MSRQRVVHYQNPNPIVFNRPIIIASFLAMLVSIGIGVSPWVEGSVNSAPLLATVLKAFAGAYFFVRSFWTFLKNI